MKFNKKYSFGKFPMKQTVKRLAEKIHFQEEIS